MRFGRRLEAPIQPVLDWTERTNGRAASSPFTAPPAYGAAMKM